MKVYLIILGFIFMTSNLIADNNEGESTAPPKANISGKVVDKFSEEELAGVIIDVEGTDISVYTDINGNYAEVFPDIYFNYTCLRNRTVDCYYNNQPYLRQWIPFSDRHIIDVLCKVEIDEAECYLSVEKDDAVLQVNPSKIKDTDDNIVDRFYTDGYGDFSMVRMHYTPKNLVAGEDFDVKVSCHNGIGEAYDEFTVTPSYRPMDYVAHRGVFLRENMSIVVMMLLLLIIFVIIWKLVNR